MALALAVAFIFWLFGFGFELWLYQLCGLVCFSAGLENLVMVFILPTWQPDFRGGVRAALIARRGSIIPPEAQP